MNNLIALTDVVIWPVTVLILAFAFRSEIRRLLARLLQFKYRDFEAKFERTIEEAETEAKKLPEPIIVQDLRNKTSKQYEYLFRLSEISPRAAIIESWRAVEQAANELAKAKGAVKPDELVHPDIMSNYSIMRLVQNNIIPEVYLRFIKILKNLRNQAAHGSEFNINENDVLRYIDLAIGTTIQMKRKLNIDT